jgi:hypothetical protein
MTLMRTHSAPPDEHAGIFELGGNGVRANTIPQSVSGRTIQQVFQFPVRSNFLKTIEAVDSPKAHSIPRTLGNGSQISSVVEEKTVDEHLEVSPSDRSATSQMNQIYPVEVQIQRGYPTQPQLLQQNFPTRMGQPRPPQENGDRSKIAPVMPMQLPPRMPHPQLMPYHFGMPQQMQMMPNQAALGSVPLQTPVFPQMMYFPK